MSELIRGLLVLIGLVVVVIAGAVIYLAMNLNELVRTGVETYGPQYTGTAVELAEVDLSLFSGEGELRGLVVSNPEGFEGGDPFRLGRVRVALDPASLTEDVIVVREITIEEAETAWKAKEQAKRADVRNEARELREHVLRQVHTAALRIDRLAVTDLS